MKHISPEARKIAIAPLPEGVHTDSILCWHIGNFSEPLHGFDVLGHVEFGRITRITDDWLTCELSASNGKTIQIGDLDPTLGYKLFI